MQSVSPLALAALLVAGTSQARPGGYEGARQSAVEAGRTLKAALHARDASGRRAWDQPGPERCAALAQAAVEVDTAWDAYIKALEQVALTAVGHRERAASAQVAARTATAERAEDVRQTAAWSAWCAALPPRATPAIPVGASSTPICDAERLGSVLVRRQAAPSNDFRATLRHTRWLSARFADDLDALAVIYMSGLPPDAGDAWHVWIDRRGADRARYHPAHLPRWRRLRAAIAIDGRRSDLQRAPSLRAWLRAAVPRRALTACPQPEGGWGWSDIGGQMGGARRIEWLGERRYRLTPVLPEGRIGQIGNGGNGLPYAPIEQYFLGHRARDTLRSATFLRDARRLADGSVQAEGRCVLDPAALPAVPPRDTPWRLGVLIIAAPDTPTHALHAQRRAAHRFAHPGPDDDPLLYNYYEATDGRGALRLMVPAPRCQTPR